MSAVTGKFDNLTLTNMSGNIDWRGTTNYFEKDVMVGELTEKINLIDVIKKLKTFDPVIN